MPKVGNKKFAYTPKGEAKAKAYAKKTGKKMVVKKPIKKANKKVKKSMKTNAKISTSRAMYDNQLVGANPSPVKMGY